MADNRPPGKNKPFQKVPGPSSARRNLFGRDPDKSLDELARDREELTRTQERHFMEKYNYDILNDRPLEGRYEWTEVIPLTTAAPLLHVPIPVSSTSTTSNNGSHGSDEAHTTSQSLSVAASSQSQSTSSTARPSVQRNASFSSEGSSLKRQCSSDSDEENRCSPRCKSPKR